MDAAKIMWLMYEHPEVQFSDIALRFMDIRKRIHTFKKNGVKATFVAIPTTSGTGSEVTPFAVVTDAKTGQKYPIADYALTPGMAIVDANMVMDMPKSLVAAGGIDAIVHAIEAYVSVVANEFSDGQALTALKLLKEYLPASYRNGASDPVAREKVHNAATIAGIAFANSFLGVCHSMAHKIGSRFHIPHGIANGLLISNVIRYNAADGRKMTAFSQYGRPQSKKRYVQIARHLGFDVSRDIDGVNELIEWIDETKRLLEIPKSIKDYGIDEAEFMASVDELAADSFDDQCTGANPRSPLISELKQLLISSYYGYAYSE
jgi:acetaldehyde dehydrogenase/alcohol dehydrogenase